MLAAAFPLAAGDVRFLLTALQAPEPRLARPAYELDRFLAEIVDPSRGLHAVAVRKRRRHYLLEGCMAELTELAAAGRTQTTIAVESEDPALVLATVERLGLSRRPNVCFSRGLKALVGLGAHRYAAIDVGTSSVKLHVGERGADGCWTTVADRSEITRLGEGLDETGELGAEPIARTVEAIAELAGDAGAQGAEDIAVVGTAGLRLASNRAALVDAVAARCGVHVEVVSGEEEARLAYHAATAELALPGGLLAVVDTGGGSSQFTFGRDGAVEEQFSLNVGAVRFTERFGLDGPVSPEVLAEALDAIAAEFDRLRGRPAPDALVAIGGSVTNLAAVARGLAVYDPNVVTGTVLSQAEIGRQIELYRTRTADRRREIVGLQPKRAEVILAGACIVRTVATVLGRASLVVSDRGLRHGLVVERFGSD